VEQLCIDAFDEGALLERGAGNSTNGSSLAPPYFDVVLANSFVNIPVLRRKLKKKGFRGQFLAIPKYRFGVFGTGGPTLLTNNERRGATLKQLPQRGMNMNLELLDVGAMLTSRDEDSKACMYPTVWRNGGSYEVCQKNMFDKEHKHRNCTSGYLPVESNWHAMTTAAAEAGINATKDSHFCMPGPLDDVMRLLLGGLVTDEAHHST
jgi:hypothetical protein